MPSADAVFHVQGDTKPFVNSVACESLLSCLTNWMGDDGFIRKISLENVGTFSSWR